MKGTGPDLLVAVSQDDAAQRLPESWHHSRQMKSQPPQIGCCLGLGSSTQSLEESTERRQYVGEFDPGLHQHLSRLAADRLIGIGKKLSTSPDRSGRVQYSANVVRFGNLVLSHWAILR
jgi:hypothetical protein